jgi:hypothetical protein
MKRISDVLVVIDPSAPDQPCLGKAMRIACACGASVCIKDTHHHSLVRRTFLGIGAAAGLAAALQSRV